jgi:hypothetical protein
MLRDVEDELDIFEITKKLQLFSPTSETEVPQLGDDADTSALDIREDWTAEDEALYAQKAGRKAYSRTEQPKKQVSFIPMEPKQSMPRKSNIAVKELVVERKPSRPSDPMLTATSKQAKESLFRKSLRKANAEDPDVEETFLPNLQ